MQLVEIPAQLFELNAENLPDATACLQRRDEPKPPEPVVLRQRTEPLFFAGFEPSFSLELPQLVNALSGILRQISLVERPIEERLEPRDRLVETAPPRFAWYVFPFASRIVSIRSARFASTKAST